MMLPGGHQFTVIVYAVPGIDMTSILSKLPDILDTCQPDIVTAMMGISDIQN